ncbi:EamA family transporter [Rhizobium halophytocola]|uniref:Drug/metabolite transporter (DMT)-like permease n=1 Tax=Rhizobium halophytocola TaxID=735519 RepID=A0ABS4E064_9HYPH|nr:EamA family transporter [Rhizobium halophytocola]MBP1851327.1 drug/metabolite transporter (DMT)-like permease [Rhizobium halophytocola]
MELWAIITFVSAFLQNLRSTLQKHLKGRMGTTGATFVRFGYGVPFALLYLGILHYGLARPFPAPNGVFAVWAVVGAVCQIAATFLLVHIFSFRNFAVGTAYSRTEPAQAALLALILFNETITLSVVVAIAISVVGVMLISVARSAISPRSLVTSVMSPTALLGLLSGFFFGVSAISYRQASLALAPSLPEPNAVMQASFTLVVVIVMQTLAMLLWMLWRDRAELARIKSAWRTGLMVGFVGATASFGWFTAMTLQQAAVVKALAQVEILFTFASAVFFFKEKINLLEVLGCLLIVCGILALLLL